MNDNRFTDREMEVVKGTDMAALAESLGYTVTRRKNWGILKEAQHIVIKNNNRYYDNYKREWGDAVTFLQDFADMPFREAVEFLRNYNGCERDAPAQKPEVKLPKKEEKPPSG